MKLISRIFAVLLLVVVAGAPAQAASASHITSFTASSLKVGWSQPVTLTWKGIGKGGCQLRYDYKVGKEGVGSRYLYSEDVMSGSYTVNPQTDTTYEIYCTNQGAAAPGEALFAESKTLTVKVTGAEKSPSIIFQKSIYKSGKEHLKAKYANAPKGSTLLLVRKYDNEVIKQFTLRKAGKGTAKFSVPISRTEPRNSGYEYVLDLQTGGAKYSAVSEPFTINGMIVGAPPLSL